MKDNVETFNDTIYATDYYPFGMGMPNRYWSAGEYRFGFNGKEMDNEVKDKAETSYDFGARIYDPRIGRWISVDPLQNKFPNESPYIFTSNNPSIFADDGGKHKIVKIIIKTDDGGTLTNTITYKNVYRWGFFGENFWGAPIIRKDIEETYVYSYSNGKLILESHIKKLYLASDWESFEGPGCEQGGFRFVGGKGSSTTKNYSKEAVKTIDIEAVLALSESGALAKPDVPKALELLTKFIDIVENTLEKKPEPNNTSTKPTESSEKDIKPHSFQKQDSSYLDDTYGKGTYQNSKNAPK